MSGWFRFQKKVPGKWVLAGEHSVLRGATAVALPHPEFGLTLTFEPDSSGRLSVDPASAESTLLDLLEAVEENWQESHERSFPRPSGRLRIESTIPMGAGLGSSAALCVALAHWMSEPLGIPESELFEFAKSLEHRFHGKSSGMDVAVVTAGRPISFSMNQGARSLQIQALPKFTFHDTQHRARTSDCILRVEKLREENPFLGMKTDEKMATASRKATEGLIRSDLAVLTQAMKEAQECYYTWELVPGDAQRLEQELYRQGALAVKLTGAGGGGFLVALWP